MSSQIPISEYELTGGNPASGENWIYNKLGLGI